MNSLTFIQENIERMENFQQLLLKYLDNEENDELYFDNIIKSYKDQEIYSNKNELKMILHLILKISNHYHRSPLFISKIEHLLQFLQKDINKIFTNIEIFNIFKSSKRIILFLLENNIIIPNKQMSSVITNYKYKNRQYPEYFLPEFKNFYEKNVLEEIKGKYPKIEEIDSELFDKFRKNEKSENELCDIIQNDSIDDFIAFANKTNLLLTSTIEPSIFETNLFLIKNKRPTLIEYAAFYGSIQIFQYLKMNNVLLTPSLWIYAIHSNNYDLIHLLEENQVVPDDKSYKNCYIESVKCHGINLMNYIKENLWKAEDKTDWNHFFSKYLQFYNFNYLLNEIKCNFDDLKCYIEENNNITNVFYSFCKYDYILIVDFLLNNTRFDINTKIVSDY